MLLFRSRKHPIHPMLVGIPIGLWVFAVLADLVHVGGGVSAGTFAEDGRRRFLASDSCSWDLAAGSVGSLFSSTAWA